MGAPEVPIYELRITILPPLKTTRVKNERKKLRRKESKEGKNGRILRGKMGKMSERIRTIDCSLSKKRVLRGARFEKFRAVGANWRSECAAEFLSNACR